MSPLDSAVWSALTGPQASLAIGAGAARRFDPSISPFAACTEGATGVAALGALIATYGPLACLQAHAVATPAGAVIVRAGEGVQMIAEQVSAPESCDEIRALGPADHGEMLALATLTEPGPFLPRTPEMGAFFGIRRDGKLVAMAGERLKPPGFVEVSGVCTHPDHRGQGHAGALSAHVARHILARGETPFLHAYATNTGAIALYERLGFRIRAVATLTVFAPADRRS